MWVMGRVEVSKFCLYRCDIIFVYIFALGLSFSFDYSCNNSKTVTLVQFSVTPINVLGVHDRSYQAVSIYGFIVFYLFCAREMHFLLCAELSCANPNNMTDLFYTCLHGRALMLLHSICADSASSW
jgi:hypothetical protein